MAGELQLEGESVNLRQTMGCYFLQSCSGLNFFLIMLLNVPKTAVILCYHAPLRCPQTDSQKTLLEPVWKFGTCVEILFFREGANSGLGLLCCCTSAMISVLGKTTCLSPEAKLKREEMNWWTGEFLFVISIALITGKRWIQQHFPQELQ